MVITTTSVFKIYLFILFLALLGLCSCADLFSSCGEWGLLIAAASLVAEHRLSGFSSCGFQFSEHRFCSLVALWPVGSSWTRNWTHVPALADRFLTTEPPEKPANQCLLTTHYVSGTVADGFTCVCGICTWISSFVSIGSCCGFPQQLFPGLQEALCCEWQVTLEDGFLYHVMGRGDAL